MARRNLMQSSRVLERILALDSEDSGDDSQRDSEGEAEPEHDPISSDEEEEGEEEEAQQNAPQAVGRDGTQWDVVDRPSIGRVTAANVFTEREGLTRYSQGVRTPLDAFRLLIDEGIIRHIVNCTNEYAHCTHPDFNLTEEELEKFIGLLYLRGFMNAKNFPLEKLWAKDMGCPAFNRTLSRDRMRLIKKFLRFDHREQRRRNLEVDKFALISTVLNRFVDNSQKSYRPAASLTVDEQLFPTKTRCRFTQYMANKPDKFGIKFWILAEVDSKFCYNVIPYLGADESRHLALGTHVVMALLKPLYGKGYNVTCDSFFTNKDLAQRLLQQRTTIVGTIRANRRELPPSKKLSLHDSAFYQSEAVHLTQYQAKRNKSVYLLSTQHKGNKTQPEGKRKPETILFYNANKFGVDVLDSMCRNMSTKAGCRRWPLAVFYNVLDLAGLNAYILFKKATGSNLQRRTFLMRLSAELRGDLAEDNPAPLHPVQQLPAPLERRVNCAIKSHCTKNRTVTRCTKCERPVCGKCMAIICCRYTQCP